MQCRTHWERRRHDADDRKKPLTAAQKKQRTLKHRAWLRAAVQLMFFIAMPGAFVAGFNGVKQLFLRIGHGEVLQPDSFTLSLLGLCGFTILFGRFFCGYVCAFGSLGDGVWWLSGLVQKKLLHRKSSSSCRKRLCAGARRSSSWCWPSSWACALPGCTAVSPAGARGKCSPA